MYSKILEKHWYSRYLTVLVASTVRLLQITFEITFCSLRLSVSVGFFFLPSVVPIDTDTLYILFALLLLSYVCQISKYRRRYCSCNINIIYIININIIYRGSLVLICFPLHGKGTVLHWP